MPRPNKRKAGEIDFDDPMSFVTDYCRRHGVTQNPGDSEIEKVCATRAMEAREEYKEKRDAAAANTSFDEETIAEDRPGRKGLSPAQKYTIRLQNNRKSANASKVYNEVFKRELSQCIQKMGTSVDSGCSKCNEQSIYRTKNDEYRLRIDELEQQIEELRRVAQQREEDLRKHQATIEQLRTSPGQPQGNPQIEGQDTYVTGAKRDAESTAQVTHSMYGPDAPVGNTQVVQNEGHYNGKLSATRPKLSVIAPNSKAHVSNLLLAGRMSDSPIPSDIEVSQDMRDEKLDAVMKAADNTDEEVKEEGGVYEGKSTAEVVDKVMQTPRGHASASPEASFRQRLASSGLLTFLPESELQGKTFHSGLTLTQSQHDDTDDKAQLLRNLPISGGIPVGLESQPSQGLLMGMKSSLGSEEMPLTGEPDLYLSSQGGSGTGTPNKKAEAP